MRKYYCFGHRCDVNKQLDNQPIRMYPVALFIWDWFSSISAENDIYITFHAVWHDEHQPLVFYFPTKNTVVTHGNIRSSHDSLLDYINVVADSHCTVFFVCAGRLTGSRYLGGVVAQTSRNTRRELISPLCCWHHDSTKGHVTSHLVIPLVIIDPLEGLLGQGFIQVPQLGHHGTE